MELPGHGIRCLTLELIQSQPQVCLPHADSQRTDEASNAPKHNLQKAASTLPRDRPAVVKREDDTAYRSSSV
ncbi:hypothetical protein EYF80_015809 [Liparis tanakae]|uniref:Uncharacterized protein n=1 Tax=Liparis tanakae TaxID=230148 RepID=A0A4Z2I7S0_9TELE|nr:hypothetical protein EYF80_015809 [Liparis tanakae]